MGLVFSAVSLAPEIFSAASAIVVFSLVVVVFAAVVVSAAVIFSLVVVGVAVEALCSRTSSQSDDDIVTCLRAVETLLTAPKELIVSPAISREILAVLHRLLLTRYRLCADPTMTPYSPRCPRSPR